MFCTTCGHQVPDGAAFCTACGAPTGASVPANAPTPAQQATPAPMPQQDAAASQPAAQPAAAPMPAAPMAATATQPTGTRGCFGSAWDDVKGSDGWFKKIALMSLIDMVPVLNFVNIGYELRWAGDLIRGFRNPLPQKIVSGENFKTGFFGFVILAVFTIVIYLVSYLLGYGAASSDIGALSALVSLVLVVLMVFVGMFVNLAYIRVGLFERLGEGFAFGKIAEAYKRKLGTLFCVSYVPSIFTGLFVMVIMVVFSLVAAVIVGPSVMGAARSMPYGYRYGYGYMSGYDAIYEQLGGAFIIVAILFLVFMYLALVVCRLFSLVMARGLGHYVARFVPEWAAEANAAASSMPAAMSGAVQTGDPMASAAPAQPYGQPYAQANAQTASQGVAQAPVAPAAYAAPAPAPAPTAPAAVPVATPVVDAYTPPAQVAPSAQVAAPVQTAAPAQTATQAPEPAAAMPAAAATAAVAAASAAVDDAPTRAAHAKPAATTPAYNRDFDDYSETSVLPEMPEDLDTIVQPEGMSYGMGLGDDSDTMVFSEEAVPQPAPAAKPLSLRITRANGDTCLLENFPLTIGKGSEADLCIPDNSTISRVHVRLHRDGGMFAAEDLGSTNKTFVNGYELAPHTPTIVENGDELKLSNEVLRISIE